jgi:hypothetical protein
MDYTQFPGRNLDCGEFNFNLLHELYGNFERRAHKRALRPQSRTLSERTLQEYRTAIEQASQDRSCTDCTLELSQGYRVFVNKLLM